MINGHINGTALKKWCVSILSYCLRHPKVPFGVLTVKFCYLKPVDIFAVLEVMLKKKNVLSRFLLFFF